MNAWLMFIITKLMLCFPFSSPLKFSKSGTFKIVLAGHVVHAFNSSTWRDRGRRCSVIFEMSLVYTVMASNWDSVSKNKNKMKHKIVFISNILLILTIIFK